MKTEKITEEIADEKALVARLIELSKTRGGAWTFSVLPFSHTVTFHGAASPSRLPDWLVDLSGKRVAYKSKMTTFSRSALLREQNRALGCE